MPGGDRPRRHPEQGDGEGFAAFHEQWRGRVYGWVAASVDDRQWAEDLTQEVLYRAWNALPRFRGDCAQDAWLYRIAVNRCRTALKRKRPVVCFSDLDRRDDEGEEFDVEGGLDTIAECQRRMLCEEVRAALESLPPEWREVVVLVDMEGLSYKEAAETLGLRLDQVRTRLSYGRRRLRELLRGTMAAEG